MSLPIEPHNAIVQSPGSLYEDLAIAINALHLHHVSELLSIRYN